MKRNKIVRLTFSWCMLQLPTLFLFFFLLQDLCAQNLVKNPSFEEGLPVKTIKSRTENGLAGKEIVSGWKSPNNASPDLFNSPFSSAGKIPAATARTGKGVVGLVMAESKNTFAFFGGSFKEYAQGELTEPLEKDKVYNLSFYMALDRTCGFTAPNIGMYLSADAVSRKDKFGLDVVPQLKSPAAIVDAEQGWVRVCGSYTASGGEKYVTIGSFGQEYMIPLTSSGKTPLYTEGHVHRNAYYFIDDVVVEEAKGNNACIDNSGDRAINLLLVLDISQLGTRFESSRIFIDAIKKIPDQLSDEASLAIVLTGTPSTLLFPFTKIAELKNTLAGKVDSIVPSNQPVNFGFTLKSAYEYLAKENRKKTHVLVLSKEKVSIRSAAVKLIDQSYVARGTTFSVLQTSEKLSKSVKTNTAKYEGRAGTAIDNDFNAEFDRQIQYNSNYRNKVRYGDSKEGRMFYFLGAIAVVAIVVSRVI